MTSSPRGGGGVQMMTIDDEGEGGLANAMMTLSQKSKIFGKFLGFYREFYRSFQIQDKNF